jgi:hypothetical protein
MRRVYSVLETILSALLLTCGFYTLNEGVSDKSSSATAMLISGAVFSALGVVALQAAVRSIIWHRAMLRHAIAHDQANETNAGHNGGT